MTNETYNVESFNFAAATPVVADAKKPRLLIPVGKTEGGPLVYPAGTEKAGEYIGDQYNPPITDKTGLVFKNAEENNWVRLPTDGTGYIIMNFVSEAKGKQICDKVLSFNSDPTALTAKQYEQVVEFAHSIGVTTTYNTNDDYVLGNPDKNKKPAFIGSKEGFDETGDRPFGLFTRAQDTLRAVFVAGPVNITGKHIVAGEFPNGAVLVNTGNDITAVQPETFDQTYLKANGAKISSTRDLSKGAPSL